MGLWPIFFGAGWGLAMREALIRLLEPAVAGIGYELVELEVGQSGRRPLLRVYIDRPSPPHTVV